MGYADGYYYGQGRIRVDTSMFSVGDTIRVRSMTDSTKIYDKTVATVGTPLIFTVPPYDTYKVCQIQTISDVVTEIGGVEVNVGFGDFVNTTPLDTNSLAYVQSVLNNHQENYVLNIGDEKTIKLNVGGTPTDWVMQIAGINVYNSHDIMFTSKHIWKNTNGNYKYSVSSARTTAQQFYADIDSKDKQFIKEVARTCREDNGTMINYTDYCFVLGNKETINYSSFGVVDSQVQMPLFVTQANRVKTYNGTAQIYWTSDNYSTSYGITVVNENGNPGYTGSGAWGVVPSFMLIADS